ncbi:hypothetical protein Tco_0360008 [Tanacetum coccineum]
MRLWDLPCVELLNENCTLIRKYPEIFLCFVGLSRSFVETYVRPTLLRDINEEMGLLDFVKSADPFKVKVGERTLAENEVPLITKTEDRVIFSSLQTISLVDHTIQDEAQTKVYYFLLVGLHSGKYPTATCRDDKTGRVSPTGACCLSSSSADTDILLLPRLFHLFLPSKAWHYRSLQDDPSHFVHSLLIMILPWLLAALRNQKLESESAEVEEICKCVSVYRAMVVRKGLVKFAKFDCTEWLVY